MTNNTTGEEKLATLRAQPPAPRVFISYSHDSEAHKNWVLRLGSDLRKRGVDAILDAWDLKPGDDVTRFMEHLASVDRVVMVCSEDYAKKAAAGKGGVGYETMLVTADILQDRGIVKFIPVLRSNASKILPPFLRTRMWIDFDNEAEYQPRLDELLHVLHEVPANPKPPLGASPFGTNLSARRDVFADQWFTKHQSAAMTEVTPRGAFMEVAFGASGGTVKIDRKGLLNVAERSTIHTFGWPIGVVLHNEKRPRPDAEGLLTQIASHGFSDYERFDYWALRLNGDFYLAQNLFENSRDQTAIFFNTRMVRVAEALLYCRNLYNNLAIAAGVFVQFRLRHSGFKERVLSTSNPNRIMWPLERRSHVDESENTVEFAHPLTDAGVVEKTRELLSPLFELFDYFEPSEALYQDVVGNFIQGRST